MEPTNLKLSPIRNSIFAQGFKFQLASKGSNEKLILQDVTPGNKHLSELQKEIYLDKAKRPVLRLKRDVNGYQMNGIIGNHAILHTDSYHYIVPQKQFLDGASNQGYYFPKHTMQQQKYGKKKFLGNSGKNITEVISYFAIFMHAVNDRFASINSKYLKIKATIVGIIANEDPSAEPYLTDCYRNSANGTCSVKQNLLPNFAIWALKHNDKVNGRDILVFINNAKDPADILGAAYVRGACLKQANHPEYGEIDASSAVVNDYDRAFTGAHIMAHELAHTFGAVHDGEINKGSRGILVDATSCPKEEGHIMSKKSGFREKYYFSSCSIHNMTNYLQTAAADCLKHDQYKAWWASDAAGGEFLTMHDQCLKLYPDAIGVWNNYNLLTPDDLCTILWCQRRPNTPYGYRKKGRGYYPADLTPCGVNGICRRGKCIKQSSLFDQCRTALKNPAAFYNTSKSADSLCTMIDCIYMDKDGVQRSKSLNKPALEHTPCGLNGRCVNGTCRVQARIPTFDEQCLATTKGFNYTVVQGFPSDKTIGPNLSCSNLLCKYPATGDLGFTLGIPPLDFTPCPVVGNDTAFCYRAQCGTLDFHLQHTPRN